MTPTLSPVARTIATVCAAVLSLALALGFGDWVGETIHGTETSTEHVDCQPLVLDEGTDYQHLIDAGWFGIATDDMEALYAPECR